MLGVALAVVSSVCWGVGGVIFKLGLKNVNEYSGNLIRSIFASLYLLPFVIYYGVEKLTLLLLLILFVSAFFSFFLGDLLYFNALKTSPVSYVLPLAATYPIFVAVMDNIIYGAKITPNIALASLATFLAIVVIPKGGGEFTLKSFTAVFASLSWAVAIVTLDYLTRYLSPVNLAFLRLVMNSAMLFMVTRSISFERDTIIYMGIIGGMLSVVGILSFITAVKIMGSHLVTPISATSPVTGAIIGKIFLREKITLRHVIAMILVFLSVLLVSNPG